MKKRRRTKQTKALGERLTEEAARLLEEAQGLPAGSERQALIEKAQRLEEAAAISDWLTSRKK